MPGTMQQPQPPHAPPPTPRQRASRWLVAVRAARKVVVSTVGGLVIVVGLALLVLPGPGMLVVLLGLGILSTEFHWPKRLRERLRDRVHRVAAAARARRAARRAPRRR